MIQGGISTGVKDTLSERIEEGFLHTETADFLGQVEEDYLIDTCIKIHNEDYENIHVNNEIYYINHYEWDGESNENQIRGSLHRLAGNIH